MLIFLAIVMGPGCGFMLYALYQFSREARRFRHADPRRLSVTVVRAPDHLTGSLKENAPHPDAGHHILGLHRWFFRVGDRLCVGVRPPKVRSDFDDR